MAIQIATCLLLWALPQSIQPQRDLRIYTCRSREHRLEVGRMMAAIMPEVICGEEGDWGRKLYTVAAPSAHVRFFDIAEALGAKREEPIRLLRFIWEVERTPRFAELVESPDRVDLSIEHTRLCRWRGTAERLHWNRGVAVLSLRGRTLAGSSTRVRVSGDLPVLMSERAATQLRLPAALEIEGRVSFVPAPAHYWTNEIGEWRYVGPGTETTRTSRPLRLRAFSITIAGKSYDAAQVRPQ